VDDSLAIGVDIGGTKVAAGVVAADGAVLARTVVPTPSHDSAAIQQAIVSSIRELAAHHPVVGVGIGAAGYIDAANGIVRYAPNTAWRDEPLRDRVAEQVGLPVRLENDGNVAAWGEYRFGAGKGAHVMLLVAVGTGIGGGVVIEGALLRGATGAAPELGHINLHPEGLRCGCGRLGCLEQYASGSSLGRYAREALTGAPESSPRLLELAGGSAEAVTGVHVTSAADEGDRVALSAFEQVGHALGSGLADLAAVFDPDVIVLGGGVSESGDLLRTPTERRFLEQRSLGGFDTSVRLVSAELGNDAGLIGAADLARLPG